MRKKAERQHVDDQELELLKAVAQAWHAQSGNPRPTDEFHARRSSSDRRPTRFKLEAAAMAARDADSNWDFAQSLWDSYEIVTLSKKLEETNFASDHHHPVQTGKRTRGIKNSLRSLFQRSSSSERFDFDVHKVAREERK